MLRLLRTRWPRRRAEPRTSDEPRLGSYPHPFPEGWYRLSDSASLAPGRLRYIECLGRQLVLWRGEDGEPHAMHAFCPHMGANLRAGRVRGNCIECPFHRWQFAPDGHAAHIPYSGSVPRGQLTETFPVQEVHGQIFMYHRCCDGKMSAADAPPFDVPRIGELDDGEFVVRGASDAGRVRMHILEFAENTADTAHFQPLHGQMRIPWTQIPVPGTSIEHEAAWHLDDDCPWKMYFVNTAMLSILGRRVAAPRVTVRASFYGPGNLVCFRFVIAGKGDIELWQTHLPVSPLEQQVNFRWFADRRLPRLLVWYIVGSWVAQWKADVGIWENKTYLDRPRLCRGDGPIHQLRRWYRQFLPEDAALHCRPDAADANSDGLVHRVHGAA